MNDPKFADRLSRSADQPFLDSTLSLPALICSIQGMSGATIIIFTTILEEEAVAALRHFRPSHQTHYTAI